MTQRTRLKWTTLITLAAAIAACASPAPNPSELADDAQVPPGSHQPVALVDASLETTNATGISTWALYRIPGATMVAGWGDHKVISYARIGVDASKRTHLDFGRRGGLMIFDAAGHVERSVAGPEFAARVRALSFAKADLKDNEVVPYGCGGDVIAGGVAVAGFAAFCGPFLAAGSAGATVCALAAVTDFGAGVAIGEDCDGVKQLLQTGGDQQNPTVVVACEGSACDSYPSEWFEDGSEGAGGDQGTGGVGGDTPPSDPNQGGDENGGDSGGDDSGGDDSGGNDGGGDSGGGGCFRAGGPNNLCKGSDIPLR